MNPRELMLAKRAIGGGLVKTPDPISPYAKMVSRMMDDGPSLGIDAFQRWAAAWMGYPLSQILGRDRSKDLAEARHVIVAAARKLYTLGSPRLAVEFNRDTHGTILNSCKVVAQNPHLEAKRDNLIRAWHRR